VQRVAAAEQKKTKIRPLSKNNIGNPAGNEYCYKSVAECGPDVVDWPLMKRIGHRVRSVIIGRNPTVTAWPWTSSVCYPWLGGTLPVRKTRRYFSNYDNDSNGMFGVYVG